MSVILGKNDITKTLMLESAAISDISGGSPWLSKGHRRVNDPTLKWINPKKIYIYIFIKTNKPTTIRMKTRSTDLNQLNHKKGGISTEPVLWQEFYQVDQYWLAIISTQKVRRTVAENFKTEKTNSFQQLRNWMRSWFYSERLKTTKNKYISSHQR